MRILELLDDLNVIELNVEVLVDALEDALELDVVFELDGDFVVDEGFEEAVLILLFSTPLSFDNVMIYFGCSGASKGGGERRT